MFSIQSQYILLIQLFRVIIANELIELYDSESHMNGLTPEGYATISLTFNASKVEDAGSTFAAISPFVYPTESRENVSYSQLPDILYTPQCQPWDSCLGRCGEPVLSVPFTCSCDDFCTSVGDCCGDYVSLCSSSRQKTIPKKLPLKCMKFHSSLSSVVISSCSTVNIWTNSCNNESTFNVSSENIVIGRNGIIYSNDHCARCNGEMQFSYIKEHEIPSVSKRLCFKSIDYCSEYNGNHILEPLCESVSGMVVPLNNGNALQKTSKMYKNIYCALCNGEETKNIGCPVWMTLNLAVKRLLVPRKIKKRVTTIQSNNIPASFSILLNFGLDGKERMMFSSEREEYMKKMQEQCGVGHIWDPFSKVCRKLYCGIEFILEDFKCVQKTLVNRDNDSENSKSVKLTLNFQLEADDYALFSNEDIKAELRNSLSYLFKIDPYRIKGMNITTFHAQILPVNLNTSESNVEYVIFRPSVLFKAEFAIYEFTENMTNSEPSLDKVLSTMADYISDDSFYVEIGNISSKVSDVYRSNTVLKTWCGPESGGNQVEYWNEDFTLILNGDEEESNSNNWINGVYINKTGKSYRQGQFVANILFQGHSFHDRNINVSGVVVVCEVSNSSCVRMKLDDDEYDILPNGTLSFKGLPSVAEALQLEGYEFSENGSVLVCCNSEYLNNWTQVKSSMIIAYDPVQEYLSLVLTCISIIALLFVLVTYISFPVLRNFPGWNTINLAASLLAMQITFLLTQRQSVKGNWCQFSARLIHYIILVTFFWMNVMAYDVYKTFGKNKVISHIQNKKEYCLKYILYAYGMPMIIVIIASIMEVTNSTLSPNYGSNGNTCWIHSKVAAIVFFAVPLAIILLINLFLYVKTVLSISEIKALFRFHSKKPQAYNEATLYVRIAAFMGFTWGFGLAAAWLPGSKTLHEVLVYLFIIFNTLQGVFIFFAFMCNKTVGGLYKTWFGKYKKTPFIESFRLRKFASFVGSLPLMSIFVSNNPLKQLPSNKIYILRESSSYNENSK